MNRYLLEYVLIAATMLVAALGFWEIYLGDDAAPNLYHHMHVVANYTWLSLLGYQLTLIDRKRHQAHRKVGLAILFLGPVLVASTALLSVHSAHKGVVSGEGDFLIVQNVMGTLELGFLILMAFVMRRRRQLHGALLLSTAILFLGIALFFALISFAPRFRIEGPETFHRFGEAAMTGQALCLGIGIVFVIKDFRNGWTYLLAALFFPLNELIRTLLARNGLIGPLTEFVGGMNKPLTFLGSFLLLLVLLAATGILRGRGGRGTPVSA